jgi:hypothetical protein
MIKRMFVLQRKPGTTRDDCLREWSSARHTEIVRANPGLRRWVRNGGCRRAG